MEALADGVSEEARSLARAFWPGALTIVCWAQPSLGWDLGETHGTVALRVPDDRVTRAVLERVGPMAVSSANRTGMPAAQTAHGAREMLQDRVGLYLDDGRRPVGGPEVGARGVASTIVDCTGETPVVLRHGAISLQRLREVVPSVRGDESGAAGGEVQEAPASAAGIDASAAQEPRDRAEVGAPAGHDSANPSPAGHGAPGHDAAAPGSEGRTAELAAATVAAAPSMGGVETAQDVSDAELVTAVVQDATSEPVAPVDQRRDRTGQPEPSWGGTSALSMAEARLLVTGEDPEAQK